MLESIIVFLLSIRIPDEIISFLVGMVSGIAIYWKLGPECLRLRMEEKEKEYKRKEFPTEIRKLFPHG